MNQGQRRFKIMIDCLLVTIVFLIVSQCPGCRSQYDRILFSDTMRIEKIKSRIEDELHNMEVKNVPDILLSEGISPVDNEIGGLYELWDHYKVRTRMYRMLDELNISGQECFTIEVGPDEGHAYYLIKDDNKIYITKFVVKDYGIGGISCKIKELEDNKWYYWIMRRVEGIVKNKTILDYWLPHCPSEAYILIYEKNNEIIVRGAYGLRLTDETKVEESIMEIKRNVLEITDWIEKELEETRGVMEVNE